MCGRLVRTVDDTDLIGGDGMCHRVQVDCHAIVSAQQRPRQRDAARASGQVLVHRNMHGSDLQYLVAGIALGPTSTQQNANGIFA